MDMLPGKVLEYFLYFSVMSFVGWIIETIYRSYKEKKFVNAGFLSGPFLLIYGFGALIINVINIATQKFPLILSSAVTLLSPTFLEYFASWILEKIFKLKLWDYSKRRFNLNGRICLKFSIIWALFATIDILIIQPFVLKRIMILGPYYSYFIAGVLFAYFMLDLEHSIRSILNFKEFQADISKLIEKGKKFIPAFDTDLDGENLNKKLPNEIRGLLKPLSAFPNLRMSFKEKYSAFPAWINKILEKI
ncbi:MAG: putative ABC transporter permease [Spirochaetaceae bacterium]|jgi:uncharacterized membrane protein|nr:putative ABC transporter permease [Spirochaetaceae bacterium]